MFRFRRGGWGGEVSYGVFPFTPRCCIFKKSFFSRACAPPTPNPTLLIDLMRATEMAVV